MKKNLQTVLAIAGAAIVIAFTSCSKTNDSNGNIPVAGLMAFNLAPDVNGVGITLSGNGLPGAPLMYTNYTGVYLSLYTGTRSIRAYDYFTGRPITASTASFEAGKYYSLFIVGANNNYSNLVVADNFDSLSAVSGQAYIRYVNAVADSSKPQVKMTAGGKEVINEQAAFTQVSAFVPVTAGTVTVKANNGGDIQTSRAITIDQRKVYTVLITGTPNAKDSLQAIKIKYVENGTVADNAANKGMSNATAISSK